MLARFALTAAAFALASTAAVAGSDSPIPEGARVAPIVTSGAHKPVATFINYGPASGTSLAGGFNNVDSATTINCGNTAGCTVLVSAMIQIAPPSGTLWAICPTVDGSYTNPPCPYQGTVPGAGSYLTGNGQGSIQVALGTHTVQTQVYVSAASTLGNWQVNYAVLKP